MIDSSSSVCRLESRRIIWCSNRLMICILDPRIHILYCPSSGCNGMECHFSMRLERSCRCLVVLNVPSVMVTGVVGLSHCMLVEGLDVHRTYCFSRYLGCNIQLQQVTGVPKDTGSMTPGSVSLSCPTLTFSCQWIATCMGVWWATGVAYLSILMRIEGPDIMGKVWCTQMLKTLDL